MLLEDYTTLILVLHAIAAMTTVALTTHLVIWMRPMARGERKRIGAARRFAWLALSGYALTMVLGMLLYPTYKVRVRGEYLENPSAIRRNTEAAAEARVMAEERHQESLRFRRGLAGRGEPQVVAPEDEDAERIRNLADDRIDAGAKISRWFDVKEHWSALGLILSAAVAFILWHASASKDSLVVAKLCWGMAILSAASAWAAAVIGLVTAALRSVAAL